MSQLFSRNGRWMTLDKVLELEAVVEPVSDEVVVEAKKPFCDKCDSKGVRHKKECPLYK